MKNIYLYFTIALVFGFSCRNSQTSRQENKQEISSDDNNVISLSAQQIEMAEIKIGKISLQPFSASVIATGKIDVAPQSVATVSAPMGGIVEQVNFMPGQFVKKGTLLTRLKHPDFIDMQQRYLETKNQYIFALQEYNRQDELSKENASSQKRKQETTSEYKTLKARLDGLASQLQTIGIQANILEKKGIQQTVPVYAPISGYITEVNINPGRFIDAQQPMYELVNTEILLLELKVYEKDAVAISEGQTVEFSMNNDAKTYKAEVTFVNRKMDENERTLTVHAKISGTHQSLKPGMFVNAKIQSGHVKASVLPQDALVRENGRFFIFTKEKNQFRKTEVDVIAEDEAFAHISTTPKMLQKELVVYGAYYLNAAMAKESAE